MSQKLLAPLLGLACAFSSYSYAQQWQFKVEPYLLLTSIDGNSTIGTVDAPLAVDFDTILNNFDSAFMLRFAAFHQSNWAVMADWGYIDRSKSHQQARLGVLNAQVRQDVLQVALAYKQSSPSVGEWINYLGLRRWDNSYQFNIETNHFPQTSFVDRDEDWVDIILGFKIDKSITNNWLLSSSGDIGGFGLATTKLTGSLKVGVSYHLSDEWDVSLLYKGTYVDYDTGDEADSSYFNYQTITHGPIISASYQF